MAAYVSGSAGAGAVLDRLVESGGFALASLRSHRTGKHVTIRFACKKRTPDGTAWVSRATREGRVPVGEADAIEVRDEDGEYVGRWYLDSDDVRAGWRPRRDADEFRAYAAKAILRAALYGEQLLSEVRLADRCGVCGKELTDPVSIDRGVGPECASIATGSRAAGRPKNRASVSRAEAVA